MKKTMLAIVCSVGLIGGLTGCDNESIALDVVRKNFPAAEHAKAMDVIECESNFDPTAVSPSNDHGLFQINIVHKPRVQSMGYSWDPQIYDPYINGKVARALWDESGWQPWTCA